jgi:hypothetical protein
LPAKNAAAVGDTPDCLSASMAASRTVGNSSARKAKLDMAASDQSCPEKARCWREAKRISIA